MALNEYVLTPGKLAYELLDSGQGRKLERFGNVWLIRPEVRATWRPTMPALWRKAEAEYQDGTGWQFSRGASGLSWVMDYGGLTLQCEAGDSKQVGIFPENALQWEWLENTLATIPEGAEVLNLFGYTGVASLVAAKHGAVVTHVDSARRALRTGQINQKASGLGDTKVRWLEEDALTFVKREVRRGRRYAGIILDPPVYGLGPKRQRWRLDEHLMDLCVAVRALLLPEGSFLLATLYALDRPPEAFRELLEVALPDSKGLELGELFVPETASGRKLAMAVSGRWRSA